MIKLREADILDILPFIFKTREYKALASALGKLTGIAYDTLSSILFRSNLANADETVLDALAAEVDAPFYSTSLSADEKRALILAASQRNSRIGTTAAVEELVKAVFGGSAEVIEWFDYGGEAYHYKIVIGTEAAAPDYEELEEFSEKIGAFVNMRAVLDGLGLSYTRGSSTNAAYAGAAKHLIGKGVYQVEGISDDDYQWLADELEDVLADEAGALLFETV